MCVCIDPDAKSAKLYSPFCSLIPCVDSEMAYRSRRDSGSILVHRCVRNITDIKYSPRRISDVKIITIDAGDNNLFAFEWSSDAPASMKDEYCRFKISMTSCGKLHCCNCTCKVGSNKSKENNNDNETLNKNSSTNKDKRMVCVHTLPNFMKLSMLLFDFLADDAYFELASMWRRYDVNSTCIQEKNNGINDSVLTLASVELTSRSMLSIRHSTFCSGLGTSH